MKTKIKGLVTGLIICAMTIGCFAWVTTQYQGTVGMKVSAESQTAELNFKSGDVTSATLELSDVTAPIVATTDGSVCRDQNNKSVSLKKITVKAVADKELSTFKVSKVECANDPMNPALRVKVVNGNDTPILKYNSTNKSLGSLKAGDNTLYLYVWYDGEDSACNDTNYNASTGTTVKLYFTAL